MMVTDKNQSSMAAMRDEGYIQNSETVGFLYFGDVFPKKAPEI
jgi:hypothetical protein